MGFTSHTQKDYRTLIELATVLRDIAILEHYTHSRYRVYPQDVGETAEQLQAAAAVDTFGDWAKIIPENTIPFVFHIVGIVVEQVNADTTYHVQIGYNPGAGEPGENQEMGERRWRPDVVPIKRFSEMLEIRSQNIPANASVWGRVKTAVGASKTVNISLVLTRHVEPSQAEPLWPAFPW